MGQFADGKELDNAMQGLDSQRPLPNEDPAASHIVYWHVFRHKDEVRAFARQVMLDAGEHLISGTARDSIGQLWWLGIKVDDLEAWGNRRSINKTDAYDPESPDSPML